MLIRAVAFIRKSAPLAGVALLLLASRNSGFSEEPLQKQEPVKKPEAAPQKKNILDYRAYRPSDSVFKSPSVDLSVPIVPAPPAPARTSKQDRELLDRQKNWIFALPGDAKKSDSAEDIFGLEGAFDDGTSKSVVTKFLENRQTTDSKSPEANASRDQSKDSGTSQIFGLGNEKQNGGALTQPGVRPERSYGNNPAEMTLAERWQELHGPRAEKAREEKRVRMNEFENLFGSQSSAAGNQGFNTPQNNFGLQPATPLSSDPGFLNRPAPSAPNAIRNPERPIPGANASTLPNINARVFGPSSGPAAVREPAKPALKPVILPIPQRRL